MRTTRYLEPLTASPLQTLNICTEKKEEKAIEVKKRGKLTKLVLSLVNFHRKGKWE